MREENNINIKKVKFYKKDVIPEELKQVDIGEKGLKEILAVLIPIALIFIIAGLHIIIVSLKEDELLSGIIISGILVGVITIIGVYAISKLNICKKIKNKEYKIYCGEIIEKSLTKTIFLDNDGNKREICGYANKKFKNAKIGEKYYNVYLKNKIKNDYSLYWGTFTVDNENDSAEISQKTKRKKKKRKNTKKYNEKIEELYLPDKLKEKIQADREIKLKIRNKTVVIASIIMLCSMILFLFVKKAIIVVPICMCFRAIYVVLQKFNESIYDHLLSCDKMDEKKYKVVHEKIIYRNSFKTILEDDEKNTRKEYNVYSRKIRKGKVDDEYYTIYIKDDDDDDDTKYQDNDESKNQFYPWLSFPKEEYLYCLENCQCDNNI